MKISKVILLLAIPFLTGCQSHDIKMLTGSYTGNGSCGIYSFNFDQETAEYRMLDSCAIVNPSYLTVSANGRQVYAVSETSDSTAAVYALDFDKMTGAFKILNSRPSHGTDPCYIATNGKVVVTANYGGSMSVFPIELDGALLDTEYLYEGSTGGPDSVRQSTPHIHCTEFTPDGKKLVATDFSADKLRIFDVDYAGSLVPVVEGENDVAVELEPDNGPRHIVFNKKGTFAYVIGELSGKVTVLKNEGDTLVPIQSVEADKKGARGAADIHISPDGRFLYASVRLVDEGIAVYSIASETGMLTPVDYVSTGAHPRNFNITPNGKYLLCACRDSNAIEIFLIDKTTGKLTDTGKRIPLLSPVCVKFVP